MHIAFNSDNGLVQPPAHAQGLPVDTLTVLHAHHGRMLAKRFRPSAEPGAAKVIAYDKAREFSVREHQITCLADLLAILQALETAPHACVVMDRLRDRFTAGRTPRNKHVFEAVAHRYVPVDLDGIEPPPGLDWRTNPDDAVRYAISTLLPAFQDVSCIWQFTASHGIKSGLRMRLWFWLDRLTTCEELKIWLCEQQPVLGIPRKSWSKMTPADQALYNRVQLIYTARPIFEAGAIDPVPHRSGYLAGTREMVSVPVPIEPRYAAPARPMRRPADAAPIAVESVTQPYKRGGTGFDHHVSNIGDGPSGQGFHTAMLAAVAAWVAQHGPDAAPGDMLACLGQAARSAPRNQGKHTLAYVEEQIANLPTLVECCLLYTSPSPRD